MSMNAFKVLVRHEVALLVRNKRLVWSHSVAILAGFGVLVAQVREAHVKPIVAPMVVFFFLTLLMFPTAMAPVTIGVHLFVGEKERRTMEPLLLLPVSLRGILGAKFGTMLAVSLGELAVFFLVGVAIIKELGSRYLYSLAVNSTTLYIAGVLLPLVGLLLGFIAMIVSARATSTQGASQTMGFVILPVVFLLTAGGASGLGAITQLSLISVTALLVVLNLAACGVALKVLKPATLIRKRGQ